MMEQGAKKSLLFAINTMGRAGAEKALVEFIATLSPEQYEVDLLVMINRGDMYEFVPEHVRLLNRRPDSGSVLTLGGRLAVARCVLASLLSRGWIFRNFEYLRRNIKEQKRTLGRVRFELLFWQAIAAHAPSPPKEYDLAVAYLEGASAYYVGSRVSARAKAAFIHTDYLRAGYTPLIDRGAYDNIDRIFVVSEQAGEKFAAVYPDKRDKIFLFRNIINAQSIKKLAQEGDGYNDGYTGLRLATVGRLCREKGYDEAIRCAALLAERGLDFRWYAIGEGPERKRLERQISAAGLKKYFILTGAQNNPYPYIAGCDIYVHLSRFEGKSIAVEEAQTLGKPIIASDCEGNLEQITDRVNGIIVPFDATAAAEKIEELAANPELRKRLSEAVSAVSLSHDSDMDAFTELLNR